MTMYENCTLYFHVYFYIYNDNVFRVLVRDALLRALPGVTCKFIIHKEPHDCMIACVSK